jgi:hypothetical protein
LPSGSASYQAAQHVTPPAPGFSEPPQSRPIAPDLAGAPHADPNGIASPPGANYELVRILFDARESVARELALSSREFQVLRSLNDSDLNVCQDLVQELHRRLAHHPLYQSLLKLDESYALALRYRRPVA